MRRAKQRNTPNKGQIEHTKQSKSAQTSAHKQKRRKRTEKRVRGGGERSAPTTKKSTQLILKKKVKGKHPAVLHYSISGCIYYWLLLIYDLIFAAHAVI